MSPSNFTFRLLYGLAVFLSAFLLFLVEPMVAKQLLPEFGGASAVWITCLVFFQTALFLGYLYAHLVATRLATHRQAWVQIAFLVFAILTLGFRLHPIFHSQTAHPFAGLLLRLAILVGVPFVALSATNPLLQGWLAHAGADHRVYRLYALSNAGSLLGLLLYPTLVEPHLSMRSQSIAWSVGFILFCALCGWIALQLRRLRPSVAAEIAREDTHDEPPVAFHRLLWFLLPACGSALLCAITSHLTQNIAAIPLLWIIPLASYLLTFILAFEVPGLYKRGIMVRLLAVFIASLTYLLTKDTGMPILLLILVFVAGLFIACLFCHAELHTLRPGPRYATHYYLWIAAGGAFGTFAVGILAPLLTSANYDLVAAFLVTTVAALMVTWRDSWGQRLLWIAGALGMSALVVMLHIAYRHDSLYMGRNFYGMLRVRQTMSSQGPLRTMLNGNIRHGTQLTSPHLLSVPTSYYAPETGVGLALTFCCTGLPRHIGVIGLGTGTVAAYSLKKDVIAFYEINPLVEPVTRGFFTYLRDAPATISVVPGDARLSLASQPPQHFDVLVIDAFSGDSIPIHLLTREAMRVYLRQLQPNGVIAFHISNQYLDLAPVIRRLADDAHMSAVSVQTYPNEVVAELAATWVLVTRNQDFLRQPEVAAGARPVPENSAMPLWTDDYSSLLPLLHKPHEP